MCSSRPGRCLLWLWSRQISGRRVACLNGPGRCVCRWAAARPRDRHTRASLGAVDLEARPGPAAALRHRGQAPQAPRRPSCLWCLWRRWCFGRRRARPPARLGILTSFGAAPRSPPVPSGPSGALHTGGAWSLGCDLARRLEACPGPAAALRHRGQAPQAPRRPPIGRACVLVLALPLHSVWGYSESVGASG